MPITLTTAGHSPRKWETSKVSTADDLFKASCPKSYNRSQEVIQTSFPRSLFRTSHISPSHHGFVWAVFSAYSDHHSLTIRPEDVWFSILTQLGFFVNAHVEELRSFFVSHSGREELEVIAGGTSASADFGAMAVQMTRLIEKNVVDEELRKWIMPEFSTTIESDNVVAAILMMGALQKYFSYKFTLRCGIPSVTLLGERQDWLKMVTKMDKLQQLGDEPARFAQLLRPVLNNFVRSFDSPESPDVLSFWTKCAHKSGGSGVHWLTGWVSAFCFWDEEGKLLYSQEQIHPVSSPKFAARNTDLGLDDVLSRRVDTNKVPSGYASVLVTVDDNGYIYEAEILAGLVGIQATSTGAMINALRNRPQFRSHRSVALEPSAPAATQEPVLDSIRPLSEWWMYKKKSAEDEERAQEIQRIADCLDGKKSSNQRRLELLRRYQELKAS